jgi:hypothetical protein
MNGYYDLMGLEAGLILGGIITASIVAVNIFWRIIESCTRVDYVVI